MSSSHIPEGLLYAESHEWVKLDGDIATVGITDHAQSELSDVVFVELPKVGKVVAAKSPAAVVESVKAASDIYAPLSGEVIEVNKDLEGEPVLVNTDPYGKAWIFKLRLSDPSQTAKLNDAAGYAKLIAS